MAEKRTILCVDDLDCNLEMRKRILEMSGYNVLTASNPRSALRTIWDHKVDLVIVDFHLGGPINGVDLARDIRVVCPNLPIIMLTGDPRIPEDENSSVNAWIIKGDNIEVLPDTIKNLLKQSKDPMPVAPD